MRELREDRRPADLWFWNDWFSSFDVHACSLAAQGLWVNMLGIMSRAETKGTLAINGRPMDSKTLAKIIGSTESEISALLLELESHHVYSVLENGTIINRRMYRDSKLSRDRAEAGKKGASSRWQNDSKKNDKGVATLECEDEDDSLHRGESEGEIDAKFSEFWSAYPAEGRLARKESRIKFGAICKRGELAQFIKGFHGYMDFLKHKRIKDNFEQRPMYAKTFLNGRWAEYVEFKYEAGL